MDKTKTESPKSDKITFSDEQGKRPKDDEIGMQSYMDSPDPHYYLEWSKTSHVDAKTWQDDITPRKHFPTPTPPFGGHSSGTPITIGQDMWRQLKRVAIPVFSGNKKTFENWKAVFTACIDMAPATPEYKLLQLRQYLSGEALKVIEGLGHSGFAYEAAKERLDRKFGGERRKIAITIEELENFRPIRPDNSKDMRTLRIFWTSQLLTLRKQADRQNLEMGRCT